MYFSVSSPSLLPLIYELPTKQRLRVARLLSSTQYITCNLVAALSIFCRNSRFNFNSHFYKLLINSKEPLILKVRIDGKLTNDMNESELKELSNRFSRELLLFDHLSQHSMNDQLSTSKFLNAHKSVYPMLAVFCKEILP